MAELSAVPAVVGCGVVLSLQASWPISPAELPPPSPLRAAVMPLRRITCQPTEATSRLLPPRPVSALPAPLLISLMMCCTVSQWILAHAHCITLIVLLLAAGGHTPLLAVAAASTPSAAASQRASGSSGISSGASAVSVKPHVVLLSLPWRGHLTPLLHLGRRLHERGFHITVGVATEESQQYVMSQVGEGRFDIVPIGNFTTCAWVQRGRERQPVFPSMAGGFNGTLHATLHPGAQLTDLYAAPPFAFQDTTAHLHADSTTESDPSGSGAPNGIALLMRTFSDFQSCMGATLTATLATLMDPATYEERLQREREALRTSTATPSSSSSKDRKARESAAAPLFRISAPRLFVVDRFTFAALDAARSLGVDFVVNNPHLLLDLDDPSWSLPASWSYLPPTPPLSIPARLSNVLHRINYRASMMRALGPINAHRAQLALDPLTSLSEYHDAAPLVFTNTIWGVELHRAVGAAGIQAFRNANPAANGYGPRFRMSGPLLPMPPSTGTSTVTRYTGGVPPTPSREGRVPTLSALTLPSFPRDMFEPTLRNWMNKHTNSSRTQRSDASRGTGTGTTSSRKVVIYVNMGDGDDVSREDVTAIVAGLKYFEQRVVVVWAMPKRRVVTLRPKGGWPAFVLHRHFVPQYEFLAHYAIQRAIALVITHASLSNVQESLAAGLPVLLLPHPTVDQLEVAGRVARTRAVRVLQRVQVSEENVRDSIAHMLNDDTYPNAAHQLATLFQPSHSQGTSSVVTQIELGYRMGWAHLQPLTRDPHEPLPFYRDFYGFPLDVIALLAAIIALAVYACKYAWRLFVGTTLWGHSPKWH